MDIYKHIFVLCLTCSLGHMLTLQMCEVMLEIESEREKCMTQVENITSGCSGTWDRISCWPSARIGEVVTIPCPLVSPKAHRGNMSNTCTADGWTKINLMAALALNCGYDPNSTAPEDGAELLNPLAHSAQGNPYGAKVHNSSLRAPKAYGYFLWSVKIGYTVGHTVSLISLMVAIVILCIFRKLHCTRNYIHINLFMSFILKAIAVFVKDVVLFQGEEDCQPAESVGCKAAMVFFHYGAMASYFWLLVEGLYLHALLAVSFFSERKYFWWYILIGWGVPAVFITVWSIIIANFSDVGCWDMFVGGAIHLWWIIKTPILTSILINFILFIRIIRILRQKINCRDIGRHESNQYSRLAKSTLLLIPLFGINFIIFGLIPDTIHYQNTRLVFDVILGSFQGFGVAVLYCFLNGEVQSEIKRKWRRWHLQRFLGADTKYQQPSLGSNGNNFSTQITMLTKCSPTTRRASACQDDLSTI